MSLKILYFGIYSKGTEYPRNNNVIRGLRLQGVDVIEAHFNLVSTFQQRLGAARKPLQALRFMVGLAFSYIALTWQFIRTPQADVVIVGHPGYFHIHLTHLLRFLFQKRALVVYDIFIPLYEALVEDRRLLRASGLAALMLHRFEGMCCRTADLCLIDTEEHRRYLVKEYNLLPHRIRKIFVGPTIRDTFQSPPANAQPTLFRVLYVGTYINLHGVEVICGAARKLRGDSDTRFLLVGSGQMREAIEALARRWALPNVEFRDWIPTSRLATFIRSCDLSLGVFGTTSKVDRVIPSKIFDICAAGAPFITADTAAIKEVFRHGENAYLIPPGDPKALAEAIMHLKSNHELRKRIAKGALGIAKETFSIERIGLELIRAIRGQVP